MGFFDGLAGGLLGLAGGIFTNNSASKQASENRQFQEDMSNTAHQREVADLQAAGLNPLLSVNSGASVPSGNVAPVVNPVSSAMDAASSAMQLRTSAANVDAIKASADASRASAALSKANSAKTLADLPTHKLEGDVSDVISSVVSNSAKSVNNALSSSGFSFNPYHPIDNIRSYFGNSALSP